MRTFWHGAPFSVFEMLSVYSFIACGHKLEIYSFEELEVPGDIAVRDAGEIFSRAEGFSNPPGRAEGTYTGFSDVFRYKLLYDKGGIWSDLDVICQKSLDDLPDACVGYESDGLLNGAVLKFPQGDPFCKDLLAAALSMGREDQFGKLGPKLISQMINRGNYEFERLEPSVFYPLHPSEAPKLLDPREFAYCENKTRSSHCVHWYNSNLSLMGFSKSTLPPKGSFLYDRAERLLPEDFLVACDPDISNVWIDNFTLSRQCRAAQRILERPISALFLSDAAAILSDLRQIIKGTAQRAWNSFTRNN